MFISYFEPFHTRHEEAFDLNFFYAQLHAFKPEEILFVTNAFYFQPAAHFQATKPYLSPARLAGTLAYYRYELPSDEKLNQAQKELIEESMFAPLFAQYNNDYTAVERHLLTQIYAPLEQYFDHLLAEHTDAECIFVIKNCPSVEAAAAKHRVPVIHYEIATFRHPMYAQTAYLDFTGVNGKTECAARFELFRKELAQGARVPVLTKQQICDLIMLEKRPFSLKKWLKKLTAKKYRFGLAGQVYNDSNLIAFSNGFDGQKSLEHLLKYAAKDDILARNHPGNPPEKAFHFEHTDHSPSAYDFIALCQNIVTINSSVGVEAVLLGKNAYVLGDSPFKFLSQTLGTPSAPVQDELLKLNFFVFGYLIPFAFLNDATYVRWRLSNPAQAEIYTKNLQFYSTHKRTDL